MCRPFTKSSSPAVPLAGDLAFGCSDEVLGVNWGVIHGIGPVGLGFGGGSPVHPRLVVILSIPLSTSILAICKHVA